MGPLPRAPSAGLVGSLSRRVLVRSTAPGRGAAAASAQTADDPVVDRVELFELPEMPTTSDELNADVVRCQLQPSEIAG